MADDLHRRKVWVIAVVSVAAALFLGYLGTQHKSSAPPGPVEKLIIAMPMVPHAALLFIAQAKGYFADEALQVTFVPTTHGKAAIDLVVQGKADLGTATEAVLVLTATSGGGLAIAANMFSSSKDIAVVARRDRGIAVPRDLAGKKVGVTLGTAGEYFLWAFLIRHKLPPDSLTLVDMLPGEIPQGLAKGTIDATSTWEPHVRKAQLALNDGTATFYEPLAYTETFNVIGRRDFLKEHSKAIERLVRAILKAEQFNRSQPEEALNLIAARLKTDVASMRPTWKNFNFEVDLRQSQLITLEDEARWAIARGYLPQGPVPNFLPHLYLDALLAVRPERVTVAR